MKANRGFNFSLAHLGIGYMDAHKLKLYCDSLKFMSSTVFDTSKYKQKCSWTKFYGGCNQYSQKNSPDQEHVLASPNPT